MRIINSKDYQEYQELKTWATKQRVFESAQSIKRLEDDIDTPIKTSVALLALLGCSPKFSCCGFDYEGQPFHKSHQYGTPYIVLRRTPMTQMLTRYNLGHRWQWLDRGSNEVGLTNVIDGNPHWRKEECIHFSEESAIAIYQLEGYLKQAKEQMQDTVTLEDTNTEYKKLVKYWQYPANKEPWVINKAEILSLLEAE